MLLDYRPTRSLFSFPPKIKSSPPIPANHHKKSDCFLLELLENSELRRNQGEGNYPEPKQLWILVPASVGLNAHLHDTWGASEFMRGTNLQKPGTPSALENWGNLSVTSEFTILLHMAAISPRAPWILKEASVFKVYSHGALPASLLILFYFRVWSWLSMTMRLSPNKSQLKGDCVLASVYKPLLSQAVFRKNF